MAKSAVAELIIKVKEVGSEVLDRLVITIDDIIAVVSKLPQFFAAAFDAYREQEKAVNTLNQAMINQGVYSAELQRKYLDLSGALQKTTEFTDDQINSAQALLQSHIGSREVSESLLKATLNLAAAKKMDLSAASDLVGKAISSENDVLARHGVHVDEAAARTDRLGAVVSALDKKFHGQAEAATKNTGSVQNMSKSFGELMEVIGERIAPAVIRLSADFGRMFDKLSALIGTNSLAKKSSAELTDEFIKQQQALDAFMAKPLTKTQMMMNMNIPEVDVMKNRLAEIKAAREQAFAEELESMRNNYEQGKLLAQTNHEDKMVKDLENSLLSQEQKLAMLGASEQQVLLKQAEFEKKKADSAKSHEDKVLALQKASTAMKAANELAYQKQQQALDMKFTQGRADIFSASANLISAIAGQGNKAAFLMSKAAAFAQSIVATHAAAANALWQVPYPANIGVAAQIKTAGYLNAAAIGATAIQGLAEGGIVRARPGGIIANIGEGGQDEAVIPLDRAGEFGMGGGGGTVNITVYGGLLGSESEAYEFARAVDRNLLKLRQNNESVAFDSGVV